MFVFEQFMLMGLQSCDVLIFFIKFFDIQQRYYRVYLTLNPLDIFICAFVIYKYEKCPSCGILLGLELPVGISFARHHTFRARTSSINGDC